MDLSKLLKFLNLFTMLIRTRQCVLVLRFVVHEHIASNRKLGWLVRKVHASCSEEKNAGELVTLF